MIYDKIGNLDFYLAFDKRFAIVKDFIEKTDIAALPEGSYEIGEGIRANVEVYEPSPENNCWEVHKKYADLQFLFSGDEIMEWAPLEEVIEPSEYNEEYDYFGSTKTGLTKLTLTVNEGSFAYFAPCDMHRPGIKRNADKVKKVIFKIPVIK